MRAAAKSATPTISLMRREAVDPFTSDLHDDGQHERSAAGSFAEEASQLSPDAFFDDSLIGAFFDTRLLDDIDQDARAVRQELGSVFHHEPPRDDLRDTFESARAAVDRHHRDDQT